MTPAHIISLIIIAATVYVIGRPRTERHPVDTTAGDVVGIVDGDTIKVNINGQVETVRYIGIDTPEVGQRGAKYATQVNSRLVAGRRVTLQFDKQRRDRFGRLLAYVYVGRMFVNKQLVRLGVARVMRVAPNTSKIGEISNG